MKITSLSEWRIHHPPSKLQSEEHIPCVGSIPFQQLQVLGCRSTAIPLLPQLVMSSYNSLWMGQDIWTWSKFLFTVSACALKNNSVKTIYLLSYMETENHLKYESPELPSYHWQSHWARHKGIWGNSLKHATYWRMCKRRVTHLLFHQTKSYLWI